MALLLSVCLFVLLVGAACLFIRLEGLIMASKQEVEQQLDALGQVISDGFAAIGEAIVVETQQVIDAIAAGGDLTSVSDKIAGLQAALTTAVIDVKAKVDAIIPPAA